MSVNEEPDHYLEKPYSKDTKSSLNNMNSVIPRIDTIEENNNKT